MTYKTTTFDYTSKSFEMDLTNLQRLPTDTGIPLIDRLNSELNDQSERLEELFTEIACENLDNPRKCAFYKELRGKTLDDEGVSEEEKQEIREVYRSGRYSKTEIQELYGLKRKELKTILGDKYHRMGKSAAWALENIDAREDDFDNNNAEYLAILAEVAQNPRD